MFTHASTRKSVMARGTTPERVGSWSLNNAAHGSRRNTGDADQCQDGPDRAQERQSRREQTAGFRSVAGPERFGHLILRTHPDAEIAEADQIRDGTQRHPDAKSLFAQVVQRERHLYQLAHDAQPAPGKRRDEKRRDGPVASVADGALERSGERGDGHGGGQANAALLRTTDSSKPATDSAARGQQRRC